MDTNRCECEKGTQLLKYSSLLEKCVANFNGKHKRAAKADITEEWDSWESLEQNSADELSESESNEQLGTGNSVEEVKSKEKVEKHNSESEEDWLSSSSEELEEHNAAPEHNPDQQVKQGQGHADPDDSKSIENSWPSESVEKTNPTSKIAEHNVEAADDSEDYWASESFEEVVEKKSPELSKPKENADWAPGGRSVDIAPPEFNS